jgi:anti-sigma regulatory factor (Ser/Thr protein kinase)
MEALTVPGTLDSLSVIGKYVLTAAATAGLDKKVSYRLRLAVDEIATNIITHGYDEANLEGVIKIRADIDETALTIYLEDTGAAYIPGQVSKRDDLHLPLEERPIGGLGVYLAIQGVDKFHYERLEGRNQHTFVVHHPSPSEPA